MIFIRKRKYLLIAIPLTVVFVSSISIAIFFIILGSWNQVCLFEECVRLVTEEYESLDLEEICMAKTCVYKRSNKTKATPICVPQKCVLDEDYHVFETSRICIKRTCLVKSPEDEKRSRGEKSPTSERNKIEVCASEACTVTAAKMLQWMDQTVHPCDDFYRFSCNGFIHKHNIDDEREAYSVEDIAADETSRIIRDILESPDTGDDSDALQKAKIIYLTCIEQEHAFDGNYAKIISDILSRRGFGKWPLLHDNWLNDNRYCRDIEWRTAMLNIYGVDSFFHLEVDFKGPDSISYIGVHVSQPLVKGMCSDNATEAKSVRGKYEKMLESVGNLLGLEEYLAQRQISDILNFDASYCRILKASEKSTKYHKTAEFSFKDMQRLIPEFNWKRWKNILVDGLDINEKLNDTSIYVYGEEETMKAILELYQHTPSKTIANYLTWKFVFSYMGFFGEPFRNIVLKYNSLFEDKMQYFFFPKSSETQRASCEKYLEKMMNIALIPPFLSKVNTPDVKKEVNNLIFLIKTSFKETFFANDRLEESDKRIMINKTEIVEVVFSHPNENGTFYDEYYSSIEQPEKSFIEYGMKLSAFRLRKLFEAVIHGSNHTDLELQLLKKNPFRKNAIAAFRENKLVLFFGELLISGVSHKLPQYLNFGSFGWIVAHELAYGFNPLFSSYNDVYRNVPGNWTLWPDYVVEIIKERARCFINNYYENEPEPELEERNENETFITSTYNEIFKETEKEPLVNESLVLSAYDEAYKEMEETFKANENFTVNEYAVDNQGIEEAFKSYRTYEQGHGPEPVLPGLNYSAENLFFVKYAQLWCSVETLRKKEEKNVQLLNSERVNGVLRNVKAFSEVFNCPANSPMNLPNKCQNFW